MVIKEMDNSRSERSSRSGASLTVFLELKQSNIQLRRMKRWGSNRFWVHCELPDRENGGNIFEQTSLILYSGNLMSQQSQIPRPAPLCHMPHINTTEHSSTHRLMTAGQRSEWKAGVYGWCNPPRPTNFLLKLRAGCTAQLSSVISLSLASALKPLVGLLAGPACNWIAINGFIQNLSSRWCPWDGRILHQEIKLSWVCNECNSGAFFLPYFKPWITCFPILVSVPAIASLSLYLTCT